MYKGEYKNMFLTAEAQGLACCAAKRWRVGYWTIRVEIIYSARCRIPKWHECQRKGPANIQSVDRILKNPRSLTEHRKNINQLTVKCVRLH